MTAEEIAGIVLQALLVLVWTGVAVVVSMMYLRHRRERELLPDTSPGHDTCERAFVVFMLAFLPVMFLWVPMIARLPIASQFFPPTVIAWVVLVLSGSLFFYLETVPFRPAWGAMITGVALAQKPGGLAEDGAPVQERGRNV